MQYDMCTMNTVIAVVMYVTDNYDLSSLYLHVEFFLACMCVIWFYCQVFLGRQSAPILFSEIDFCVASCSYIYI